MSKRAGLRARLTFAAATAAVLVIAASAAAQTPYVPYFGKNQIRYDNFEWYHYETDHFIIYYYPEIEPHLERMAAYAESAYQHISSELKHDLAHKVPLILFQTSSEFQQQNVIPGAAQEGVGAFAEPVRNRIVMPMDEPPDLLYRLIVHELTHQFDYDIVPASLVRETTPLWVHEGLADYMTGFWRPLDLMAVRDAAIADIIPKMSRLQGYSDVGGARMIYNLGHAIFEFMEERWGKDGIRQYLFSLRKSVIGGGADSYEEAFRITAEEFDQEFDRYLKERFRAFRDKERPADYGRNLTPNPERTRFAGGYTVEPSPSGDLVATFSVNSRDREGDIILVSAQDGSVVTNLTEGFDKDLGFEFIVTPGGRFVTVPWLSWSHTGDRLGYFARAEKSRTLILQNVISRNVEQRIEMDMVDDPESPDISPDGRQVAFAALEGGTGDIFVVDLATEQVRNVTNDEFADSAPTWSPDGRSLIYLARISGNEKLFRVDLGTGEKTQLTFGTHDDGTAKFLNDDTIVFPSTATDPTQPIDPDVARNGHIYNVWTLTMSTGELRQYTDAVGGNLYTAVVADGERPPDIAMVSYFKGEYELRMLDREDPIVTVASSDFGSPGPIIDFQAPLSHTLVEANMKKKGRFEKMFIDGRPPVNVGVTSGGNVFGGTAISFSDVLGDQQFSIYIASISQYRTLSFAYTNRASRFNYGLQAFSQDEFFYGAIGGVFYDPAFSGLVDRNSAIATRTVRGVTGFGIWPLNRYRRLELSAAAMYYNEQFNDPALDDISGDFQEEALGPVFRTGPFIPLGVAFVQETTVFREFGPLAGNTMRLGYEFAPDFGSTLSRQTADLDARYYQRLGATGVLALRARAFKSWGEAPDFLYFGGNSEMRGYDYLEFVGHQAAFFNAELRFPLIEAMLTPIGVLGGVRGVFFVNLGGAHFEGQEFTWFSNDTQVFTPIIGFVPVGFGQQEPVFGEPVVIDGFRLVDSRASYGIGLQTLMLGFPIHFDWAWRTMFNREWEDAYFRPYGGSDAFREVKFRVWMGYDF